MSIPGIPDNPMPNADVAKADGLLPVTQADREAYFALHLHRRGLLETDYGARDFREQLDRGECDSWAGVQAFSRHRLASQATDAKAEDEDAAWTWLESKWFNVEAGHDPNDRDYSADEMVDAFMAGQRHRLSAPAKAEEGGAAALVEALEPFARLELPTGKRDGNAGFYSIFHKHIEVARAALAALPTPAGDAT